LPLARRKVGQLIQDLAGYSNHLPGRLTPTNRRGVVAPGSVPEGEQRDCRRHWSVTRFLRANSDHVGRRTARPVSCPVPPSRSLPPPINQSRDHDHTSTPGLAALTVRELRWQDRRGARGRPLRGTSESCHDAVPDAFPQPTRVSPIDRRILTLTKFLNIR
jgi:hypothetical protein